MSKFDELNKIRNGAKPTQTATTTDTAPAKTSYSKFDRLEAKRNGIELPKAEKQPLVLTPQASVDIAPKPQVQQITPKPAQQFQAPTMAQSGYKLNQMPTMSNNGLKNNIANDIKQQAASDDKIKKIVTKMDTLDRTRKVIETEKEKALAPIKQQAKAKANEIFDEESSKNLSANDLMIYYNEYLKSADRAAQNGNKQEAANNLEIAQKYLDKAKDKNNGLYDFVENARSTIANAGANIIDTALDTHYVMDYDALINGKEKQRVLGPNYDSSMRALKNLISDNSLMYNPEAKELYKQLEEGTYKGTAKELKNDIANLLSIKYMADQKNRNTFDEHQNYNNMQELINEKYDGLTKGLFDVETTIANMTPSIATSAAGFGPVGSMTALGANVKAQTKRESIEKGINYHDAETYSNLVAATEVATELIGGESVNKLLGISGGSTTPLTKLMRKFSGNTGSSVISNMIENLAGEATEEAVSEALDPLWKSLTNQETYDLTRAEDMDEYLGGIFQAAVMSVPSTLIMGGASMGLDTATAKAETLSKINTTRNALLNKINNSLDLTAEQKIKLRNEIDAQSKKVYKGVEENFDSTIQKINQEKINSNLNDKNRFENYETQFLENQSKNEASKSPIIENQNNIQQATLTNTQNQNLAQNNANTNVLQNNSKNINENSQDVNIKNNVEALNLNPNKISSENSLLDIRNMKKIGDRKVNAYQYDNPEVKPYFKKEAEILLDDLRNSLKGERYFTENEYGETVITGQKRATVQDIADLLDGEYGPKLTYKQIATGLENIIQDQGSENNAASKRIEAVLDKRLREGYKTSFGENKAKNNEYMSIVDGKNLTELNEQHINEINEYLDKAYESLPESEANIVAAMVDNATSYEAFLQIKQEVEDNVGFNPLHQYKDPSWIKAENTNMEKPTSIAEQKIRDIEEGRAERDTNVKPINREEMMKNVEKALGQKAFSDKRYSKGEGKNSYGIYKPETNTTWIEENNDFDTAIHELAHSIDYNVLKHNFSDVITELNSLRGTTLDSIGEPSSSVAAQSEVFAEAFQEFIFDPVEFSKTHPRTTQLLLNEMQNNKEFNKRITALQDSAYRYINMSAKDRLLSNISITDQNSFVDKIRDFNNEIKGRDKNAVLNETKNAAKDFIDNTIIKNFYDSDVHFKNVMEKIAKGQNTTVDKLSASDNAYLLYKLSGGVGEATSAELKDGVYKNGKKVCKGFNEILEENDITTHEDVKNLIALLMANDTEDYVLNSKEIPIRMADAYNVQEELKDTKYENATKEIYKVLDFQINKLIENGIITKETAQKWREMYKHYVPTNRVGEQNGKILQKRKGSNKQIINPLENIITNITNENQFIAKNNVMKTLINSCAEAGIAGDLFDVIDAPESFNNALEDFRKNAAEQGIELTNENLTNAYDVFEKSFSDDKNMILSYMENGQKYFVKFKNKGLYDCLSNANSVQLDALEKFLSKPASALRWGATAANIAFAIPNFIADSQMAYMNSDAVYIPVVDSLVGIVDTLAGRSETAQKFLEKIAPNYVNNKRAMYYQYKKSGANSGTRASSIRQETRAKSTDIYGLDYKTLYGQNEPGALWNKVNNATTALSDLSEEATRFRNFEKEVKKYTKDGMSLDEAVKKAGYNAQRVTQDFNEMGTVTRRVNRVVPFTGARMGGVYQTFENAAKNPKRFATRLAVFTAINAMTHYVNKMLHKDDKADEELQNRKRLDNYVFLTGDNEVVTVKKVQGPLKGIINLVELAVDYGMGDVSEKELNTRIKEIKDDISSDAFPVQFNEDGVDFTKLIPPIAAPALELAFNRDSYYGNDILNSTQKKIKEIHPEDVYDENTTETAKALGKILKYPPIYIDHLVEGYLAGVGTQALKASDYVINSMNGRNTTAKTSPLSETFVLSRFFADSNKNSKSVNDVYDRLDKLESLKQYPEEWGENLEYNESEYEKLTQAKKTLSLIGKKIKAIKVDDTLTGIEKQKEIAKLQELKTDTARYYTGKDKINAENKEKIELYEFYPSSSNYKYKGKEYVLDDADQENYAKKFKAEYEKAYSNLIRTFKYKNSSKEDKEKLEDSIRAKSRNKAKDSILAEKARKEEKNG